MGLPFMSRNRNMIWPGVPDALIVCAVPATASRYAYSGRAPSTLNLMHWVVPLRHAVEADCWPAASGPTVRVSAAIPPEVVIAAVLPSDVIPLPVCHATAWPAIGTPLLSTKAWVVQETVAPAARDNVG